MLLERQIGRVGLISFLCETGFLLGAFWLAVLLAESFDGKPDAIADGHSALNLWAGGAIFGTVIGLCLYFNGLYNFNRRLPVGELWLKLARALALSGFLLWAVYLVLPGLSSARGVLLPAMALSTAFLLLWRHVIMARAWQKILNENVLIVGSDPTALALAREIEQLGHLGYRVVGFLADPAERTLGLDRQRVLGTPDKVLEVAQAEGVTRIVVAQRDNRGRLSLDSLLECKTFGFPVSRASEYYEKLTGKILLDNVRIKSWLVFSEGFVISKSILLCKRSLDLVAAAVGLVLAAPLMALIAIAVRLDSPGPVLYQQERMGRHGKPFTIWKFRSMKKDAERGLGASWAKRRDARVTRVGRLLRRTRMDELPQLWNILRGDMSMVGPRPEREDFAVQLAEFSPLYNYRLAVRPGLTGWAQIRNGYAGSVEESVEKLGYDLYYLRHMSLSFDLLILARTARVVLLGRGAV